MEDAVSLQLRVFDLALQHHQLLLVLLLERVQPPLAVLQLVDQLLLDGDLTSDVGQIRLEVLCGPQTITTCSQRARILFEESLFMITLLGVRVHQHIVLFAF